MHREIDGCHTVDVQHQCKGDEVGPCKDVLHHPSPSLGRCLTLKAGLCDPHPCISQSASGGMRLFTAVDDPQEPCIDVEMPSRIDAGSRIAFDLSVVPHAVVRVQVCLLEVGLEVDFCEAHVSDDEAQ